MAQGGRGTFTCQAGLALPCHLGRAAVYKRHWSSGAASRKLTEELPRRASGNISPCRGLALDWLDELSLALAVWTADCLLGRMANMTPQIQKKRRCTQSTKSLRNGLLGTLS